MEILVCIKQVLDTAAKIQIEKGVVVTQGIPRIINPYDEFAIEEALRIKERMEGVLVTLITFGPEEFRDSLRRGLAMGADNAIHILSGPLKVINPLSVAVILERVIKSLPYDLILCGRQAIDDDMAQVGPALAVTLGLPYISVVTKLVFSEDSMTAIATRQVEGGVELIETSLPVLLTCQKGLNEPRLPSLKGIMKSKKKEIKIFDVDNLGLNVDTLLESQFKETDLSLPPERKKGIILDGSAEESVPKLVRILRDDLKIV